jgi:hypothetical protein
VLLFLIVFFAVTAVGQTKDKATAIYASNGTLVGLSDLVGLLDCAARSADGKLRDLDIEGDKATFRVKKKDRSAKVEVDLARLSTSDRTMAIRDLIRKSNPVRVAGYTCGDGDVITAFSIDRVY